MATGQLQIIHSFEPEFFVLDVQEQPLGVNLFGAVMFLAFFEARREQQVVIGVLGFDFQGLLEVRTRLPGRPCMSASTPNPTNASAPRVQFRCRGSMIPRVLTRYAEVFAHVASRLGKGVGVS